MRAADVKRLAERARKAVAEDPGLIEDAKLLLTEFQNSFQVDEYETLARFYKEFPDAAGMLVAVEALRPEGDPGARAMMFDHLRAAEVLYQGEDLALQIEERLVKSGKSVWMMGGEWMTVDAVVPYMRHFIASNRETLMPEVLERIEAVINTRLSAAEAIRALRDAGEKNGR